MNDQIPPLYEKFLNAWNKILIDAGIEKLGLSEKR